jgi:RluA family pseudouridine synthase
VKPRDLVIWIDPELLVVNKPAGVLAIPSSQERVPDLVHLLEPEFGRLWVIHRLDRDTSGTIAFARSPKAHQALNDQFAARQPTKLYHALVHGDPPWVEQRIDLPLRPDGDRAHRTVVAPSLTGPKRGKLSLTELYVLERFHRFTLVQAHPQTGRTHQIRAHLAAAGFPIVADALYGGEPGLFLSDIKPHYRGKRAQERPLLGRVALHAASLEFEHPTTGALQQFQAPYPKDLAAALYQLRKYAQGTP